MVWTVEPHAPKRCGSRSLTKRRMSILGARLKEYIFNNSQDIPILLISLKVRGMGIHLTCADYVIHYDKRPSSYGWGALCVLPGNRMQAPCPLQENRSLQVRQRYAENAETGWCSSLRGNAES